MLFKKNFRFKTSSLDYCDMGQDFCEGHKNIPRYKMPVIEGDNLKMVVKNLQKGYIDWKNIPKNPYTAKYPKGFKYHERSADGSAEYKVAVSDKIEISDQDLKPLQKEINLDKAYSIAVDYLINGDDDDSIILVSKEGYIIDGHHRWASVALLNKYGEDLLCGGKKCNERELLSLLKEDSDKGLSLTLTCIIIDLPVGVLLDVLNACTDSLGVLRKSVDREDAKKVKSPLDDNDDDYIFEKMKIKDIETSAGFKKVRDKALLKRIASLRERLFIVRG